MVTKPFGSGDNDDYVAWPPKTTIQHPTILVGVMVHLGSYKNRHPWRSCVFAVQQLQKHNHDIGGSSLEKFSENY